MTICNLRTLIGRKGGDHPSSLHTRRWRPTSPKKTSWMKKLHGILHGRLWITFHGLPEFSIGLPPRGGPDANVGRPWFYFIFIFQRDKFQGRFPNIFHNTLHDKQTPPSSSLKLVGFETSFIKANPPIFSANKICNGPATWPILTSHSARGSVTTYNNFPSTHGMAFGWESRVLTITRSRLLARVWSGPNLVLKATLYIIEGEPDPKVHLKSDMTALLIHSSLRCVLWILFSIHAFLVEYESCKFKVRRHNTFICITDNRNQH